MRRLVRTGLPSGFRENQGLVLGIVGTSGVGKGYTIRGLQEIIPDLKFIPRYTTREPRPTDPSEGVVAVPHHEFQAHSSKMIGIHKPFGDASDIVSGFHVEEAMQGMQEGKVYVTDPNIHILREFVELFGHDRVHLIGLAAHPEYIAQNLRTRTRKQKGVDILSEADEADISVRISVVEHYNEMIRSAHQAGLLHALIEVNDTNRDRLVELAVDSIRSRGILLAHEDTEGDSLREQGRGIEKEA